MYPVLPTALATALSAPFSAAEPATFAAAQPAAKPAAEPAAKPAATAQVSTEDKSLETMRKFSEQYAKRSGTKVSQAVSAGRRRNRAVDLNLARPLILTSDLLRARTLLRCATSLFERLRTLPCQSS